MRWPIVRLIAFREARDQLRDRRTMFLILGLPLLMYPLFVGVGIVSFSILKDKKLVVGVVGAEFLPKPGVDIAAATGGPVGVAFQMKQFPPLIANEQFLDKYLPEDPELAASGMPVYKSIPTEDESLLPSRQVDALLVIEPGFAEKLERGERPSMRIFGRDGPGAVPSADVAPARVQRYDSAQNL